MAYIWQMTQDFQVNGGHLGKDEDDNRGGGMTEDTPI
jgi:hypothetical protein